MIAKIGVIGSGTMGAGIAQVAALAGFEVTLLDTSLERSSAAAQRIAGSLNRQVEKGAITAETAAAATARITPSAHYAALAQVEMVIEAVFEDLETKRAVIFEATQIVSSETVFATNTSSISITQLAAIHPYPDKVVGMHFFNPVPVLPLVEVIRAEQTAPASVQTVIEIAHKMGKTPVEVNDAPGFVVNRVLIPMVNEAIICLETGVATRDAIDETMRLGASHPMGPLALADLVGLDVVLSIMEVLHRDLGDDKYRPAVSLRRMVAAGKLGRKSGEGFYVYP